MKKCAECIFEKFIKKIRKFANDAHTRNDPWRNGFVAGLCRAAEIAEKEMKDGN